MIIKKCVLINRIKLKGSINYFTNLTPRLRDIVISITLLSLINGPQPPYDNIESAKRANICRLQVILLGQ